MPRADAATAGRGTTRRVAGGAVRNTWPPCAGSRVLPPVHGASCVERHSPPPAAWAKRRVPRPGPPRGRLAPTARTEFRRVSELIPRTQCLVCPRSGVKARLRPGRRTARLRHGLRRQGDPGQELHRRPAGTPTPHRRVVEGTWTQVRFDIVLDPPTVEGRRPIPGADRGDGPGRADARYRTWTPRVVRARHSRRGDGQGHVSDPPGSRLRKGSSARHVRPACEACAGESGLGRLQTEHVRTVTTSSTAGRPRWRRSVGRRRRPPWWRWSPRRWSVHC
ncbi:hypothetical protein QFZ56_007606 [Streptomyces achromogenes]|uniref:Uncharacterized protein n=1 Tax=Streptomyces achromogenes TaxID=67255 RepID=A0ABU0QDB5_STRAH|nr:hypothetical protein [Streptomyces achromogenes]